MNYDIPVRLIPITVEAHHSYHNLNPDSCKHIVTCIHTQRYNKRNIERIEFNENVGKCFRLREQIAYNKITGNVSYTSRFEQTYKYIKGKEFLSQ